MNTELLHRIFSREIPLLDVRAPLEFAQGAFPTAVNVPILNDAEREQVGISYKQHGAAAATTLGYELVSGNAREQRIALWMNFLESHPDAYLYCFRGGMRSEIAQQWIQSAGRSITRIEGGFKNMRNYLISVFDRLPPMTIISGKTGVGKTQLIHQIEHSLDLEGYANHRGSAFGQRVTPQPAQVSFENQVAIALLKSAPAGAAGSTLAVEDEGRMIGRLNLPIPLHTAMKNAPIVLLEDSLENRVHRIYQEYVVDQLLAISGTNVPSTQGGLADIEYLRDKYLAAMSAIKKRLGGVSFDKITSVMSHAFSQHVQGHEDLLEQAHKDWIGQLLTLYYDPMYEYQINLKRDRIVESGDQAQLKHFFD
jgi:tRNA 2-selenouridine synthase